MILDPNGTYLSRKMHIILVNSSLRGTKQSLADRHQTLIDCHATARNDGDFGLSKCHSYLTPISSNLSRPLKTFERYGFVEMVAGKRSKKPVAKSVDFDICIVRNKTGVEQSGLL